MAQFEVTISRRWSAFVDYTGTAIIESDSLEEATRIANGPYTANLVVDWAQDDEPDLSNITEETVEVEAL